MTNPTGLPPGVPVPPRNPINAGQAFIGLCNARGVALQLFYYRVIQVFVTNIAGMTGAAVTLSGVPTWKILFPLACGSTFACFLQYPAMGIMKRSAERVDLWTGKLAALENTNGVEGGVRIFSSPEYESLKSTPAFPVQGLLWLLGLCMVIRAGFTGISIYLLTQAMEVVTCIPVH